jgi:tetratricopeptide (TPR) repeat protein
MRRYEQVLDDYQKALFFNQQDADIWFERGMHYSHELINFEAAASNLKRATELNADKSEYWYEYAAVLHYKLDCEIVIPLKQYLRLCDAGSPCHPGELKWALHARNWLEGNKRCS